MIYDYFNLIPNKLMKKKMHIDQWRSVWVWKVCTCIWSRADWGPAITGLTR